MEKIQAAGGLDDQMCLLDRSSHVQVAKRGAVGETKTTGSGDSNEEMA